MYELHTAVGDFLRNSAFPGAEILLDQACGGPGQIRLYGDDVQGEARCMTYADAAILFAGEVKVIIEMDYSNVRPNAICGKLLSTAISAYYKSGPQRVPFSDSMLFVQVIQHATGDSQTHKVQQCRYLESEINRLLKAARSRIACYSIHYGKPEDFTADGSHGESLRTELSSFLGIV